MMSGTKIGLAVVVGLVSTVVIIYVVNYVDEPARAVRNTHANLTIQEQQALAPTWLETKRAIIEGAGFGGRVLAAGLPIVLLALLVKELILLRHHKGIFPAYFALFGLRASNPPGDALAQREYARVSGVQRPLGRALPPRPEDTPLLNAPASAELDPGVALHPDLAQFNNVLFIGSSGCGKTNAGWATVGLYRQALPDVEFLVCSLVASKWPGLCLASDPPAMLAALRAVDTERQRRDTQLTLAGVTDVHQWAGMAALIVVLDEAESAVRSLPGGEGVEFKRLLDRLVNTGRNVNMGLLALSQTGDRDFFPKSILANSKIFIGRSGQWVPQAYGIQEPKLVEQILHAERGHFYSLQDRSWLTVPVVKPPKSARLSQIYQPSLQLAPDAEADGLGGNDAPSSPLEYSSYEIQGTRYTPPQGGSGARYTGIAYRVPNKSEPSGEQALTDFDETLHRRIWDTAQVVLSNKAVQKLIEMGYEGGTGWYLIREIRRLGNQGQLPWQE
jgi:hypothetical protein